MKKSFDVPAYEVVRFGNNDIVTASVCGCNVMGTDFGLGEDECVGRNLPECTCKLDNPINCV